MATLITQNNPIAVGDQAVHRCTFIKSITYIVVYTTACSSVGKPSDWFRISALLAYYYISIRPGSCIAVGF